MRMRTTLLIAAATVMALASTAGAQSTAKAAQAGSTAGQNPRFEETLVVTATPERGSPSDHYMTFSGPVAVPGVTLPAGTYIFRTPAEGGKVVQVLKGDRAETYSMFMTIPVVDVSRSVSSAHYDVTFRHRAAGSPPAIDEWFVPGRSIGYEFVYPS